MRSYLEVLNELRETMESDVCMPESDKAKADKLLRQVFDLLWKYSD